MIYSLRKRGNRGGKEEQKVKSMKIFKDVGTLSGIISKIEKFYDTSVLGRYT